MHAKFQTAGFQTKRDVCHRSLDFVCLFLLGHLLVQVIWWFLAVGSTTQASVEDFKPINENFTSNICYIVSHTLIKFSVFMVCGSLFFNTQTTVFTRHIPRIQYIKL